MTKYEMLVKILDEIRQETTGTTFASIYLPSKSNGEAVNQARSRALLHLYLKVSFGLFEFQERESVITDGRFDGGIDAYYIDRENRTIYFIQAKFRTSIDNFESKMITPTELLVMDINRVADGEMADEKGNPYNSAIHLLQEAIRSIGDIGRYKYRVVILANAPGLAPGKLKQLTGGYDPDIFDYERAYSELVFPVISGTFFCATDLQISIDLSNKSAGAKIRYEVNTAHHDCEITVLFVPTIEIARIMHRYKNSILKLNPRSYLELQGHQVNSSIRETILESVTNEFALFNNGITMLSDETDINERVGQRNRAQLTVKNPQIINGGQTAYTLSRILEETDKAGAETAFSGKEVLLKVITLIERQETKANPALRGNLINRISNATNQQTPVINADKLSNDADHIEIQRMVFDRYGALYERKRGEFADGLHQGYITPELLIERNLFFRLYYAVLGDFPNAVRKKLFLKIEEPLKAVSNLGTLDKLYYASLCYRSLARNSQHVSRLLRNRNLYLRLFALTCRKPSHLEEFGRAAEAAVQSLDQNWAVFRKVAVSRRKELWNVRTHPKSGVTNTHFDYGRWVTSGMFAADAESLFGTKVEPETLDTQQVIVKDDDIE